PLCYVPAPAPAELSPLSLHDALPIWRSLSSTRRRSSGATVASSFRSVDSVCRRLWRAWSGPVLLQRSDAIFSRETRCDGLPPRRSEEHTSELQSQSNLVCRLLLEKKK